MSIIETEFYCILKETYPIILRSKNNIFWFQISVSNPLRM